MQTHTLLALSNPVEGREAEFNQWFDTVHIPEVLRVPGFASVQLLQPIDDFVRRYRGGGWTSYRALVTDGAR